MSVWKCVGPWRVAALLGVAGCLSGCAGLAEVAEPKLLGTGGRLVVPDAWANGPASPGAHSAEALAQWWSSFNDPLLTQWVRAALQAHTGVRQAQAALQQSRAQQALVAASDGVSVRANAAAQRGKVGDAGSVNTFRAGLDAAWEPDVFGVQQNANAAAQADVRAAQANVAQVQVSLAAEVALATIELQGLHVRRQLAQDSLARQEESLQLTAWRVQAGLASAVDLEQARTAVAQTRATLPALETAARQTLNALAVLTGQEVQTLQRQWAAPLQGHIPQPPPVLALAFPAEVLRQRPDVRVAEERVRAAWARARQTEAERYPTLALSGSLGLAAPRLADLFDLSALTRSVLASVTAAVLDGGAQRAREQVQDAVLAQALLAHEGAVRTALQDVENALVALQGNRERGRALQTAVEAATNADHLARHRYASGLIDYRTLLDTQRTLLAVQGDGAATQAAYSADHVRLYKALGGGWAPDAPPPVTPPRTVSPLSLQP